jgi:hypothetical protein
MRLSASHAARYVACHGVRSNLMPVALVGSVRMPMVWNVASKRARRTGGRRSLNRGQEREETTKRRITRLSRGGTPKAEQDWVSV